MSNSGHGTTLPSPRFVVREIEGWRINHANERDHSKPPGLTVWVADEAYLGREIKIWRSEQTGWRIPRAEYRARIRAEARALADRLNAEETSPRIGTAA